MNQSKARWGALVPPQVRRGAVGLQAGGHGRLGLHRLLVEIRAETAAAVETVAADGAEVALLRQLHLDEPAQSFEPTVEHGLLPGSPSAHDQGMSQFGVVIREFFLEPAPVRMGAFVEAFHQAGG